MMFKLHSMFNKYLAEDGGDTGDLPGGEADDANNDIPDGDDKSPDGNESDDAGDASDGDDSDDDSSSDDDAGNDDSDNEAADYADFDLPDGMDLDNEMLAAFTPELKKLGLNQEQAQGLVNIQAGLVQAQQLAQIDAFSQQKEDWFNESKADKDFGGDKFEESTGYAIDAIKQFGTPELQTLLEDTGLGNHKEMIRLMAGVGRATREDKPGSGSPKGEAGDRASILYPES